MKILNKISNLIINVMIFIVFVLLIFAIYNFIQLNVLKNRYVNYFGYTYFEIQTGSMESVISKDDYVFVKITKDVKENDIISFFAENDIVTHRVVYIDSESVVTKGDANNAKDKSIGKNNVIGKVVYIGHKYGKYVKFIKEPAVFITFFITIILFNIALSDSSGERSKDDEKKVSEKKTV